MRMLDPIGGEKSPMGKRFDSSPPRPRVLGTGKGAEGRGQQEEIRLGSEHQAHRVDSKLFLPWLPSAFPPERRPSQKKKVKKKKEKDTHSVHS